MAVAPVDGYGVITSSNAKEIYTAYKKGEVTLTPAQQKYCENFLSPEEIDEISYDTDVSKKEGKDKIGDAEKAESHDGQGGNAAGTSAGMAAGAAGAVVITKNAVAWAGKSGWAAIGLAAATLACAVLTKVMASAFDNGYKDRTGARDNGDDTNATIDGYTNALLDTMDMMNEDMELYQGQSEDLTTAINTNTSQLASLQIDLADAQSAGDTEGAANIRAQIQQLQGVDNSKQMDEMNETKERLTEYQAANSESIGVSEAGQTVADFLKQGTALGVVATLDATLLTVATAMSGMAIYAALIGGGKDASHLDFGGLAAGIAGSAMFGIAAAMLGWSATQMATKAKNEFECGSKGGDIEGHVSGLNDMINEQLSYTETTSESFDATDEDSSESQAEAQEAAAKAVQSGGAVTKPKKKDKDDDDKGNGSGAGSTGSGQPAAA